MGSFLHSGRVMRLARTPEIQLLYKARATRPEDQADFDQVVPQLTQDAQTWLRESLQRIEPEHAWISKLN